MSEVLFNIDSTKSISSIARVKFPNDRNIKLVDQELKYGVDNVIKAINLENDGRFNYNNGFYQASYLDFLEASRLLPDEYSYFQNMAMSKIALGDYDKGLELLNYAIDSFLNIQNGVMLSTGDVNVVDPSYSNYIFQPPNNVSDPDLLNVANEVPPLLPSPYTNSFSVSSINDVAILEFDFIPNSTSLTFDYAFGSLEYYEFENTEFNDVFGFFISGPGISGPYASPSYHPNGAINLATVPSFSPDLPITVSSVNDTTPFNDQFFIDNRPNQSNLAEVKGLTKVLTANAAVIPGQTYHIRLAIADGSDNNYNSFIWLSGGSFSSSDFSPTVSTNLSDNTCGASTDLTFTISQDPNEEDIDYASITTSGGSFDLATLAVGDNICLLYTSPSPRDRG